MVELILWLGTFLHINATNKYSVQNYPLFLTFFCIYIYLRTYQIISYRSQCPMNHNYINMCMKTSLNCNVLQRLKPKVFSPTFLLSLVASSCVALMQLTLNYLITQLT